MALTLSRWAALTVLTSATLAVALLPVPPRDPGRRFMPRESSRLQQLSGQLDRARDALEVVRLEETVMGVIGRNPLPPGVAPTVLDIGAASEEQRKTFSEALEKWWPRELNDSVAVGIVLGGDSTDLMWRDMHLLPADTDGHTCITLVSTYTWRGLSRFSETEIHRRFSTQLAPCLFLAMLGRPGPEIERWLLGRGFGFATYFNPRGLRLVEEETPDGTDPFEYVLFELEWSLYGNMPLGIGCLNGKIGECTSAVFSRHATSTQARRGFRPQPMPWRSPFGSLTGSYLADLYREIGPERFKLFWNSTLPLDQAIREATGLPLGEWTYRWAVGRRTAFRPGPLPERKSVIRVAGLGLVLLGVAFAYGTRRTVSSS